MNGFLAITDNDITRIYITNNTNVALNTIAKLNNEYNFYAIIILLYLSHKLLY